jgi:hypothetical protein
MYCCWKGLKIALRPTRRTTRPFASPKLLQKDNYLVVFVIVASFFFVIILITIYR